MTSPDTPGFAQQDLEGRSVRDVVAYSPDEVNDAWCRKVLRKILKSLELQYAMEMPHRAITPDTIVFHANGEPLLISDDIDAAPAPDAHQADDLTALARVIHYAITHELMSAGPLNGRVDGYSAAVVATIDACMDPDLALRPRSVDAVRSLLGMVETGPVAGAITLPGALTPTGADAGVDATIATASPASLPQMPSPAPLPSPAAVIGQPSATAPASPPVVIPAQAERASPAPAVAAHRAGMRRGPHWAIAAGGGAIAIALALVLFPVWRDAGSNDTTVLTPPPAGDGAHPGLSAPGSAAPAGTVSMDAPTEQAAVGADVATGAAATAPAQERAGGPAKNADGNSAASPANDVAGSAGASSGGTTHSGGDAAQRAAPEPTRVTAPVPPVVSARAAALAPANDAAAANAHSAALPGAVPGNASYQLQIKPWGVVYVDGVERGVSPPVKRLALTPGRHTVRITNPKYRDSVLEFESALTTSNGKIIVDFTDEAQ